MTKTFGGAARLFLWHTNKAKFLKRALETRELPTYVYYVSKRKKSRHVFLAKRGVLFIKF